MGKLKASWTTLKEGIGYRRFAISGVVGLVTAIFYRLAQQVGSSSLLEIPHWAVGLVILLTLFLYWMVIYADSLRA